MGRGDSAVARVSIAGAILWGVLRTIIHPNPVGGLFQSQGRFFGGCCVVDEEE